MSPDASWSLAPGPIALLLIVTAYYVHRWWAVRERPLRLVLFLAGIATTAIALLSPVDTLGEQLFTMHMVQHLLLLDVAAILLILGLSRKILRPVTKRFLPVEERAGFFSTPIFAITAYVLVMWFWHIPRLYDLALENDVVHVLEHLTFAAAGALYWWHIFSPIRPRHRLIGLGAAGYMASTKVFVGLLGVFLTFSPENFYGFYEDQPDYWNLSPTEDQAVGGAIMALEQMIVMGGAFAWLFIRMLSESNRADERAERFAPKATGDVPRVFAEFDASMDRTYLTANASRDDLHRQGIALREGLELKLWNDDAGEVDAVAHYDPEWGGYFAELRR